MKTELANRRVLLFAIARDLVGADEVFVSVGLEPSAGEILLQLGEEFPELRVLLPTCRLAVDCEYVSSETLIKDTESELALIPPVSGG